MSLAQIGEFAFVLLSRASNLHLVEVSGTNTVYWQKFSNRELTKGILYPLDFYIFLANGGPWQYLLELPLSPAERHSRDYDEELTS